MEERIDGDIKRGVKEIGIVIVFYKKMKMYSRDYEEFCKIFLNSRGILCIYNVCVLVFFCIFFLYIIEVV